MSPPSGRPESKPQSWLPFVLWLIPIIFGSGTVVAAVTTVSKQVDAMALKLEAHMAQHPETDRRLLAAESKAGQCERSDDALRGEVRALQDRVSRLEQNVVALCATQRSAQCVR